MTLEECVATLDPLTRGLARPPREMRRRKMSALVELNANLQWSEEIGLISPGEADQIGLLAVLLRRNYRASL